MRKNRLKKIILKMINPDVYGGGNGESPEDAIKINLENSWEGVAAEYTYLEQKFGKRGVNWQLKQQALIMLNSGNYDLLTIVLSNADEKKFYFDISKFY